jgi:hypothetical protein
MNKIIKIGQGAIYKRNDHIWPWGYYRPHSSPTKKDGGWFVTTTETEAKKRASQLR